jgi:branched-chain amino acid transport system ATP-binding protein
VTATAGAPAPFASQVEQPLLRLDDVHTFYVHVHALQGITLEVFRGEIVTLLGGNGAGKTTTLRTISGMIHPRSGTVHLDDDDITHVPAHKLVRRGVGHAPE